MSLLSEKIVEQPNEGQLTQARHYMKARLELEQQGVVTPKFFVNVYLHTGGADEPIKCSQTEFTELAHQVAAVYRAIYGKELAFPVQKEGVDG